MSDWDPRRSPPPLSPPSAPHDEAPSSDSSAAASRDDSPRDSPPLTSEIELRSLNQYIEEYLRLLGLDDLAHQFKEKAEKAEWEEGLPPVPFVRAWVDMSIKSAKFCHSYPRNDGDAAAIAPLNVGVAAYLKDLEIDFESFNVKASSHVVQKGSLIRLWLAVVYPELGSVPSAEETSSGCD